MLLKAILATSIMFTVTICAAEPFHLQTPQEASVTIAERQLFHNFQPKAASPRDIINSSENYLNAKKLSIPKNGTDIHALTEKFEQWKQQKQKTMGGVDTGGGTVVEVSPGVFGLLDLYLYNHEAFNDRRLISSNINPTKSFSKLGIGLLSVDSNPLWQKTLLHIEKWTKTSPILAGEMRNALSNLYIYFQNTPFTEKSLELYLPPGTNLLPSQLKTVAVFYSKVGVSLDYNLLQQLPEKHQLGLLIHETLRFINYAGMLQLTNDEIQRVTAQMVNDPMPGLSLDGYVNGRLMEGFYQHYSAMKSVQLISSKICRTKRFEGLFCDVNSDLDEDSYIRRFMENRRSFQTIFNNKYMGEGPFPYSLREQREDADFYSELNGANHEVRSWILGGLTRLEIYNPLKIEMITNSMRYR